MTELQYELIISRGGYAMKHSPPPS